MSTNTPPRPPARRRHRWANKRGKLHGLLALERVMASYTLRRMARWQMPDAELRQELDRRARFAQRRTEHREWQEQQRRTGVLLRIVDAVVAWFGRRAP